MKKPQRKPHKVMSIEELRAEATKPFKQPELNETLQERLDKLSH